MLRIRCHGSRSIALVCAYFIANLLVGCGRSPIPQPVNCVRLHEACAEYAQSTAGDVFEYFALANDCEWDFGGCLSTISSTTSCTDNCMRHSYIESTCQSSCDSHLK